MIKQEITKKQWLELNANEQDIWVDFFMGDWTNLPTLTEEFSSWEEMMFETACEHTPLTAPNIGEMIAFLGDDLKDIEKKDTCYVVCYIKETHVEIYSNKELVDALWRAVKYKLRNK